MTQASAVRHLLHPLWFLLALVFLFEAWLWEHLKPVVAFIVGWLPLRKIKLRVAAWIEHLPPYPTLLVFLVPVLLLLPLKFLGLWMLAHGFWLGALAVLALAKVTSLGVTAFIFEVTRPKLLQLPWFRTFYEWMLWALERAHALIDPVKLQLKRVFRLFAPKRAGRTIRLLWRIRRRVQAARAQAARAAA